MGSLSVLSFPGKSIPPPEDEPDEECQLQTDVKAEGGVLHFISVALHMSAFHLTFSFCAFHFAKGHINSCPLDQSPNRAEGRKT